MRTGKRVHACGRMGRLQRISVKRLNVVDCSVEHSVQFYILGVIINENLTWNYHIDGIARSISLNTGMIKKLKYMPERTCILYTLYCTLKFKAHFLSNSISYSSCLKLIFNLLTICYSLVLMLIIECLQFTNSPVPINYQVQE